MSALHDRVAVVTGTSSGIGAAVATAFADLGAHVVVNSVSSVAEGEQMAAKLTDATYVQVDVSEATDDMIHEVAHRPLLARCWPRPRVVSHLTQPAFELGLRQLDRLNGIHLAPHPLGRPAQPQVVAQHRASVHSRLGDPAHSCRSASSRSA
jgi:hypothetical protein